MNIPKTPKIDVVDELHGHKITDSYRWLEDIESSEVKTWLKEQDTYTRSVLDSLPARQSLHDDFQKLFREETVGAPYPKNGLYFYVKRKADEDLPILYVKKGLHGEPRALLDPNVISKEKGFVVEFDTYSVSNDASLIAYTLSDNANDSANLYAMDVATGEVLKDVIPGDLYPYIAKWAHDNSGYWYTRRKDILPKGEKFHRKIFFHKLGTEYTEDILVFGEELQKEDIPLCAVSADGKYLTITSYIYSEPIRRTEIYFLDLQRPDSKPQVVVGKIVSENESYFFPQMHRGYLYIHTNMNAPTWKIQRIAVADISKGIEALETIVADTPNATIGDFSVIADALFVTTLENVQTVLKEYTLSGTFVRVVPLPMIGTATVVAGEKEGREGFFLFNSFTYPNTVFRLDLETDEITVYDQQKVAIDTSDIVSEQVWYTSKDGTKVPMFLVYKKGLERNGNNPTVLNGYGGFNFSFVPQFQKEILPFIVAGGVHVVANIRGGGEFGSAWHKAGTKKNKQNTFDDFIAAAEWLIDNKYTSKDHLAIRGGSNGGLLVGALMTQRPDLVKAVIMSVPVADMLRYHLTLGGRLWIADYGNAEDPDMFPYMLAYSPYHNVKDGVAYPATYIQTSAQDDRVHPGHSFKMAARLQEANSSNNPIILRVESNAGHAGATDISRVIKKTVDIWSFLYDQLGM
jgi:prolyl oligopeptidase